MFVWAPVMASRTSQTESLIALRADFAMEAMNLCTRSCNRPSLQLPIILSALWSVTHKLVQSLLKRRQAETAPSQVTHLVGQLSTTASALGGSVLILPELATSTLISQKSAAIQMYRMSTLCLPISAVCSELDSSGKNIECGAGHFCQLCPVDLLIFHLGTSA